MKIFLRELGIPSPHTLSANDAVMDKILSEIRRRIGFFKSKLSITIENNDVVLKIGKHIITKLMISGDSRNGFYLTEKENGRPR